MNVTQFLWILSQNPKTILFCSCVISSENAAFVPDILKILSNNNILILLPFRRDVIYGVSASPRHNGEGIKG